MGTTRQDRFDRDGQQSTADAGRPGVGVCEQIAALEKHIASQRQLSNLLEAGSIARAKSDAICRDMVVTLDRLRSKIAGRPVR